MKKVKTIVTTSAYTYRT